MSTLAWISGIGRAAVLAAALLLLPTCAGAAPEDDRLAVRAAEALLRAAGYFRDEIAVHGSYGWRYSTDLTYRRGEALMTPSQGWVQPPGTPAVGLALLQAYAGTGDVVFRDAAVETAHALAMTQLDSGGWHAMIEFDPKARRAWCYRVIPEAERDSEAVRDNRFCDGSLLDDNISQSALLFLMRADVAVDRADPVIRDAVEYGLERFMATQYPNGAWPVRLDWRMTDETFRAAWRARYPEDWSRTQTPWPRLFFATNDNLMGDMIRVFLVAYELYGEEAHLATALRAAEFLLAAQMPEPQPGWAQQYNAAMEPMWGRKFEPPALSSWETQRTIGTLLDLYERTGDERYLEAAGRAAAWLERVRLANGQWARFYELQTDRPLYFDRDYHLTYDDDDLPRHYGFKDEFDVPRVLERYRRMAREVERAANGLRPASATTDRALPSAADLAPRVEAVVDALDHQGRWVDHRGLIHSATFIANVDLLARYLAAIDGRALSRLALLDR